MKKLLFIFGLLITILSFTSSYGGDKEKILSPYFFVQSDDASLDPFPLLETKAEVNIAGVIADIELTQVYKNDGKRTIEAIYVFPLGTKSAIHAMRMKIGTRIIEAKIEEREMAKAIYERAKGEGKVASLLEQEDVEERRVVLDRFIALPPCTDFIAMHQLGDEGCLAHAGLRLNE